MLYTFKRFSAKALTQIRAKFRGNGKEETMNYTKVPTLSLRDYLVGDAESRAHFVSALFSGLKYYGFIILKDHPISSDLLDRSYRLVEKLFALPEAVKSDYISKIGGRQRGYTPFGAEHAKNSKVHDLKEFWHIGRDLPDYHKFATQYPKNIWPNDVQDFRSVFSDLYLALDTVGDVILEALTGPLEIPTGYFSKMVQDGNNVLRLLHYPPLADTVDPRCIRAAAHEDINLLTILVAATTSGLELLDRDGRWLPIETSKNNLIIDAGDMMARITNDVIPATTHRVVNPQDGRNDHRYSMPFFIHPNPDAVLSCIPSCKGPSGAKYNPIGAQEFLLERLKQIGML
jgi:isopenicillin N synthase-like dioxygenase